MDFIWAFYSLFSFGCFAMIPTVLAAAAIVDILRVRAEWYWLLVVLFIPVLGPLAYFLASYGPWANRMGRISPAVARRAEAKRRLKELDIQLQHWRGPSILAEAGEILLSLNKKQRAEALLKEAHGAGAEPKECYLPLASVLQVSGRRWQEARPLLEKLVELEPDYKFGVARLALARTYDELGETDKAEQELRQVLVKRNPPEAKVRLARLLLRRGDGEEAARLLSEVRADAGGMPKYLRRQHAAWIRVAKRLKASTTKFPSPRFEGLAPSRPIWGQVLAGAAVLGGVVFAIGWVSSCVLPMYESTQQMTEVYSRLAEVDERLDALRGEPAESGPLEELDLGAAELEAMLELRAVINEACTAAVGQEEIELTEEDEKGSIDAFFSELGMTAMIGFAQALANEMELRGLVLEDLARHFALVDWRLLERPPAAFFDLPNHFRSDYLAALGVLSRGSASIAEVGPEYKRIYDRQRQDAQGKVDDLRESVAEKKLTETTRTLLESRRQELESSLDSACLPRLQSVVIGDLWSAFQEDEEW